MLSKPEKGYISSFVAVAVVVVAGVGCMDGKRSFVLAVMLVL